MLLEHAASLEDCLAAAGFRDVPGIARKHEFAAAVRDLGSKIQPLLEGRIDAADLKVLRASPLNLPIADLVLCYDASVRLANCMKFECHNKNPRALIGWIDLLGRPHEAKDNLLRIPNLGLRSYIETRDIALAFARSLRRASDELFPTDANEAVAVTSAAESEPHPEPHEDDNELTITAEEAISSLKERESGTLVGRLGMAGAAKTLEELGQIFGVTRERIRQIESKALKTLRQPRYLLPLKRGVHKRLPKLLSGVIGNTRLAPLESVIEGLARTDAGVRLLNRIDSAIVRSMLSVGRVHRAIVAYVDSADRETAERLAPTAIAAAKRAALPVPVSVIAEELRADHDLVSGILQANGHAIYLNWVIEARSQRRLRTVHVAHLLQSATRAPTPAYDLWQKYRAHYGELDPCSGRDLHIVLQDHPQFFVNLHHLGWKYVGPAFPYDASSHTGSFLRSPVKSYLGSVEDPSTLGPRVYAFLRAHGPAQFYGARAKFGEMFPEYSEVSFGVTLVMHPEFLRFAPGIYGVPENFAKETLHTDLRAVLRDRIHVEAYLLARLCGPPYIDYPAWSPAQEFDWATYLHSENDDLRLAALLSVARLDEWPLGPAARATWRQRQSALYGRAWHPSPPNRKESSIDPHHLYELLEIAEHTRSINLPYANAGMGWRIDTGRTWVPLALLTAAGMLNPKGAWFATHELSTAGEVLLARCRAHADVNALLAAELLPSLQPRGWVSEHLLAVAKESCAWDASAPIDEPMDDLSIDAILERSRKQSIQSLVSGDDEI